ncbi:hypothetical protein IMZ48_13755 [Candidatus Bathyarchaeota archaeon]|nr:hypothetical protein [Candidatus Bathyarchaeota archaeon]
MTLELREAVELIYSSGSLKDHRAKVRQVMARLQEAGLHVDIDKCAFEVKEVKYLGFIVEAGEGVRTDPEKIAAIVRGSISSAT